MALWDTYLPAAPPLWQSYALGCALRLWEPSGAVIAPLGVLEKHHPTDPPILSEWVQASVACFLLQEVEVLVAWLCLTLCDPTDHSPTRLLCPWDFPGKNTGVGGHSLLQGIFLSQGSNPHLLHSRQILYRSEPPEKPDLINGGPEGSEGTHCESQMGLPSEPQGSREQGSTVTCPRSHDGLGTLLFFFFFLLLSIIFVSLVFAKLTQKDKVPRRRTAPLESSRAGLGPRNILEGGGTLLWPQKGLGGVARTRGRTVPAMPLVWSTKVLPAGWRKPLTRGGA